MKLKLKQINLLKKSDREDALRLSLQNSANPTTFASDNLYEFILEKTNSAGLMSTKLMAVAISHTDGVLSDILQKFIAIKMICAGQPSVTFNVDVNVELYIDPPSAGRYPYVLSMLQDITIPSFKETSHYEYGSIMTGHIEYLVDKSLSNFYFERSLGINNLSEKEEENAQHVYGNFAWNIPVKPQEKFIDSYLNRKQPFFALDEKAIENTEKYNTSVGRLVAVISGLASPTFAEDNLSNNLYFIDKIASYRVFDQSTINLEESRQIGTALWWHVDNFFKKDYDSVLGCFVYPLTNSKGVIGNNQYGQLESAGFYCIEQGDSVIGFNLAHTLVRSTYTLTNNNGATKTIPYCMPNITDGYSTYDTIETSHIYWKSYVNIATLHANYRNEHNTISTQEAVASGSASGAGAATTEGGTTTATTDSASASNVNDPSLFIGGPVQSTDEFKAMQKRLEALDYTLKELDGSYYAIPKSLTIVIPYSDADNGINIAEHSTYGDICDAFQLDRARFCHANGVNYLKYDSKQKVYVGQVLKIPISKMEYLKVSDTALMAASSPTFKIPNSNYIPAESALETYETLSIDDRDALDGIVRHADSSKTDANNMIYSDFGPHMLRIGDCTMPISPLSITVTKTSQSERISTLRTRNSLQTKSGYSVETLSISLYFNGTDQINGVGYQPYEDDEELVYYRNGLRPLIAQFMKAPFLPIENELINHTYGIYSICLQDLQLHSVPEFPHCIEVTLTLLPFDHSTYMFNEEFFEGAFCWPLFRWYYQQKMIKESPTQLKPYVGNDIKLFTHKIDFAGNTEDILFNPANMLVFSIPQEGALKTRKNAIHELYQKKPPSLFEEENQKFWIGSNTADGTKLYLAYQQYKNFTVVKNYYPVADYPDLYESESEEDSSTENDFDVLTLATYGQVIDNFANSGKSIANSTPEEKYCIVEALSVYLSIYTNTYQYATRHYFIINGFNPITLHNAFSLLGQNLDQLVFTGNEADEWIFQNFDALRYKNALDTVKTMKVVYETNTDIISQQDLVGGISYSIGGVGAAAAIGGALLLTLTAATGWGLVLLLGGAAIMGATAALNNQTEDHQQRILSTIEFKGNLDAIYSSMFFGDVSASSFLPQTGNVTGGMVLATIPSFQLLKKSPDGLALIQIEKHESILKLKDEGMATDIVWLDTYGDPHEIVPSAITLLEEGLNAETVGKAEVEAYKAEMEELRYLAHRTEEDIPTKTITLTDIIVQSCTASLSNRFAPLQTQKAETPTYQFLGGSDITMRMSFVTKSRVALNELWRTMKESQYLAREYRIAIVNGVLDFHHPFFDLLGAKSALVENISIETSDESAETFNVVLDLVSFDKTQKKRETLNKDGFGMVFDDQKDWNIYQKLKRSNSDFEYSNVDLMLKEAELYPDLELPTYQEVNEFLTKHPIKDKFGIEFNYYANVTNCKYVDPDFYLRCEETLRDFVESKLNKGDGVGMILHDKYNNAILSTCPSRDEQISVKNKEGEIARTDPKTGQEIGNAQNGPGLYENSICAQSIKTSAEAMVAASLMGAGSELSSTAYYYATKGITARKNQTAEEKQEAQKIMAEYRATIDLLINVAPGFQIESFVDSNGETVDIGSKRKVVTLDFSRIRDIIQHFINKNSSTSKSLSEDYIQQLKDLKQATLNIAVFDEGNILDKVVFDSSIDNLDSNIKVGVEYWYWDSWNKKNASTSLSSEYQCGVNPSGEYSLLITLLTLYVFIHFADPDKIGILLDQNAFAPFYFIINKDFEDILQKAFDNVLYQDGSEWMIDCWAGEDADVTNIDAADLFWIAYRIDDEDSPSNIVKSFKDTYKIPQKFENTGIFFYEQGYENTHCVEGYTLLKNTMEPLKEVSTVDDSNFKISISGSDLMPDNEETGEDVQVWEIVKTSDEVLKNKTVPVAGPYDRGTFGMQPISKELQDQVSARMSGNLLFSQAYMGDFLSFSNDFTIEFRYRIDFQYWGDAFFDPVAIIIDKSKKDLSSNLDETNIVWVKNLILYATLLYYGSWLSYNLHRKDDEGIISLPPDLKDKYLLDDPDKRRGKEYDQGELVYQTFIIMDSADARTKAFLDTLNKTALKMVELFEGFPWSRDDLKIDLGEFTSELVSVNGPVGTSDPSLIRIGRHEGTYNVKIEVLRLILTIMKDFEDNGNIHWATEDRIVNAVISNTSVDLDGNKIYVVQGMRRALQTQLGRFVPNLNVMQQQYLFRTSFNDLIKYDCRGRLVRAFPSYHMTIIDEGDQGLFYSMWDNFYAYNSVVSIDVYKDRRIIADTAIIKMTNIYHNLSSQDTDFLYDDYDYTFFDAIKFGATEESKAYWKKQWSLWFNLPDATLMKAQQEKVSSIVLSPGARMHLRMGYGSDAYNLPVLFNGVITEVSPEEIMTICAQGDGVELTNKLQVGTNDTTDPGAFESLLEPRMIIGDMFTSRGSIFKNIVNKVSNNWFYQSNPLGIAHFGQNEEASSMVAWESAPLFVGWWCRITNHETETNNYGPALMNVYAGGAARSLSKWAYTDLSQRNEGFSGDKFAWKWNVVNWFTQDKDVNEIPTARIYLFDMTVNDVCQMLAACCPDYICAVAPFELRSTLFFGRPSWGYAKEYANMYKWDGQLKQLVKERAGYSRQSFSQTRLYNSYTDIISNKITATSEYMKTNIIGIYNEKNGAKQTAVVQIDSDLDDDCQTTGTVHLPLKADMPGWNYWHQGKFAEIAAISELKNQAGNMYQGELTVLGDPSVKPHDKMYIQDSYVDMHGMVGVRAVHHEISMETGLISSITPDLLSIHDDSEGLEGIMWISQVASEVTAIVASLALTKISWRMFLNGPVAERVKQLGVASVNYVVHGMMGRYTEDGLLQGLVSLDNSDDLLKALNTSDEALAMTNMQAYADNLARYVDDRWKVTQVIAKYGDDLNFADPEVARYITWSLDKAGVKTLSKTDGVYDMAAVAKMTMSEDEIVQLHTIARVGSSKADDSLKAGFASLRTLSADIDNFGSGKFLSKGLKNKSSVILKDKQVKALEKIVTQLGDNADDGLTAIVKAASKGQAIDGGELMNLLKAGRTRAASNLLGDTTIDIAKVAGKGTQHGDDLIKMCQKFSGDWHAGVAVRFGDNAADAVKSSRRSWKVGQKVKILFGKADDAADLAKLVNKADDVKDVIKFGTSLAGSLRASMHAIGTAVAPGIGTALTIAAEIAFEILTEMAFEFYFRWKRRRQALILAPLIYRGHSFIAGLDGHQGAVLGDQPGVIDSMLMGQGFCSGVFNFLNCITGSDIDYGNQTLSQAYNDWKTQVNAWEADFSVSDLDGLGIEELEQPNQGATEE